MSKETECETDGIGHRQILLLILLGWNSSIVSINHTLPAFQGYTPHFFCQVDNVSATVDGCVKQLHSAVEHNEPSCPQGYQFQSERNDWTIATEWQLVCERRFLRPLIATIYFCGVTVGAIVCGLLADKCGRRPLVLSCLYGQGLLGVSLYFTESLKSFMIVRFIQGFFVQGLQGTTFALLIELFPTKFRTLVAVVIELYWSIGLMYIAGASYLVPQWRKLELVLSIPTAATLLYVCLVPESPRWLKSNGKSEEANRLWSKIRQKNMNIVQDISTTYNVIADKVKFHRNSIMSVSSRRDSSLKQTVTKCESCKSLVQIVVNNFHTDDSSSEDSGTDTGHNTLQREYKDYVNQQKEMRNLREGLYYQYDKHDNDNHKQKRNNSSDETNADTEVIVCDAEINNDALESDSCGEHIVQCHVHEDSSLPGGSEVVTDDKSEGALLCSDWSSSMSKGLNQLWQEIVQELEFDIESKLQDVDDNDECKRFQNGKSYVDDGKLHSSAQSNDCVREAEKTVSDNTIQQNTTSPDGEVQTKKTRKAEMEDVDAIHTCGSLQASSGKSTGEPVGFLELFRNAILRKYSLIMVLVWFTIALSYYGIIFHLPGLSGERHLNFFIGALLEAASFSISYVVLSRIGRRLPMSSYILISGFSCLGIAFISVIPEEDAIWLGKVQTALALIGKSSAIGGFCTMFLYASELFPTILRGVAMGHCGFWARVGSLIAPQLLFLGEYTMPAVPLIIIGALGLFAGLLVLILPETLGKQLPDSVEDAEMLARKEPKIQKTNTSKNMSVIPVSIYWFEDQPREI